MLFPTASSNRSAAWRMQFMAQAVLIAFLGGWLISFLPWDDLLSRQGTPLGADFSMFYVAGEVASDGQLERLYDQAEHQQRLHRLFPKLDPTFCLPYRYPPLVAVLFAPIARLDYAWAYGVFFIASVGAWLLTVRLLAAEATWRGASYAKPLWWALAACPVALETFIGGQASAFAALIAVATLCLIRNEKLVLAGAVLAVAVYKPNVLALFGVGLVIRFPRMLYGAIPVAAALVGICYAVGGESLLGDYATLMGRLTGGQWDVETPLWKVHSLAPWFNLMTPGSGRAAAGILGLVFCVAVGFGWRHNDSRRAPGLDAAAAGLLVINALCNTYTPIYDLLLLVPAVVYALNAFHSQSDRNWNVAPRSATLLFVSLFLGPHISQAIAKISGVQIFPVVLAAMTVCCVGWARAIKHSQDRNLEMESESHFGPRLI